MKANTKKYQYYRLENKHLSDVSYIIRKAFKKKLSVEYLQNKYNSSHHKIDKVATIAYNGKIPIAFYGAIPQMFRSNDQDFLIAHACDSFTLPEYQKKGLHFNLAEMSYKLMRESEIKMVYAFHSENTFYSTKKLNWEKHIEMKRFHFYTQKLSFAKMYNKLSLENITVKKAIRLFEPYLTEVFENPILDDKKRYQVYSDSFYNYKESFNRHFKININDCVFYLKVGAIIHIGHFEFPTNESLKKAISILKMLCIKIGVNEILFQVDPGTSQYKGLSSIKSGLPSWLIGYFSFDKKIDISEFGFNYSDLDTF